MQAAFAEITKKQCPDLAVLQVFQYSINAKKPVL